MSYFLYSHPENCKKHIFIKNLLHFQLTYELSVCTNNTFIGTFVCSTQSIKLYLLLVFLSHVLCYPLRHKVWFASNLVSSERTRWSSIHSHIYICCPIFVLGHTRRSVFWPCCNGTMTLFKYCLVQY